MTSKLAVIRWIAGQQGRPAPVAPAPRAPATRIRASERAATELKQRGC
jgi:hypothetical protein